MIQVLRRAGWPALFVCLCTAYGFMLGQASIAPPRHHKGVPPARHVGDTMAEKARQAIPPQSSDERLADYTELLAWFTGVLAVVSIFQGFLLLRADKTARAAANAAERLAIAARNQSEKLGEWASISERQTDITAKQSEIQSKQHELSRLQYFAVHGPKVWVRRFRVFHEDEKETKVEITLINTGSTDALLGECEGTVYTGPLAFKTAYPDMDYGLKLDHPEKLEPNMEAKLTFYAGKHKRGDPIYVAAKFSYTDDLGRRKETAILRRYDVSHQRFVEMKDPEYEYDH